MDNLSWRDLGDILAAMYIKQVRPLRRLIDIAASHAAKKTLRLKETVSSMELVSEKALQSGHVRVVLFIIN